MRGNGRDNTARHESTYMSSLETCPKSARMWLHLTHTEILPGIRAEHRQASVEIIRERDGVQYVRIRHRRRAKFKDD